MYHMVFSGSHESCYTSNRKFFDRFYFLYSHMAHTYHFSPYSLHLFLCFLPSTCWAACSFDVRAKSHTKHFPVPFSLIVYGSPLGPRFGVTLTCSLSFKAAILDLCLAPSKCCLALSYDVKITSQILHPPVPSGFKV